MTTIVTRASNGAPLTNTQMDTNLTNLNNNKLELSGGTVTGQIKGITPVAAEDLTRKDYVDTMLPKAGGTMSGRLYAQQGLDTKVGVTSPVAGDGNIYSGTWTATASNFVNVTSAPFNSGSGIYLRVGNVVYFKATWFVTPTASGQCSWNFNLPVNSSLTHFWELTGTGFTGNAPQLLVNVTTPGSNAGKAGFQAPSSAGTYVSIHGMYAVV